MALRGWQGANQSFSVSPVSGVIPRGGSQPVEVTFNPPNSGQIMEGFLTLKAPVESTEDICASISIYSL